MHLQDELQQDAGQFVVEFYKMVERGSKSIRMDNISEFIKYCVNNGWTFFLAFWQFPFFRKRKDTIKYKLTRVDEIYSCDST